MVVVVVVWNVFDTIPKAGRCISQGGYRNPYFEKYRLTSIVV